MKLSLPPCSFSHIKHRDEIVTKSSSVGLLVAGNIRKNAVVFFSKRVAVYQVVYDSSHFRFDCTGTNNREKVGLVHRTQAPTVKPRTHQKMRYETGTFFTTTSYRYYTKDNRLVHNYATDRRGRGYVLERMFTEFSEITQCNGHYAVQGHSRSPILAPIESSYTVRLPISD